MNKKKCVKVEICNFNIVWLSPSDKRDALQEFGFTLAIDTLHTPKVKPFQGLFRGDFPDEITITIHGVEKILKQSESKYQSLVSFANELAYSPPTNNIDPESNTMAGVWEKKAEGPNLIFSYIGDPSRLGENLPCKFSVGSFYTKDKENGMGELSVSTEGFEGILDDLADISEATLVYEKRFAPFIHDFTPSSDVIFKGRDVTFAWNVSGDGYIRCGVYRGEELVAPDMSTGVKVTEDTTFVLRADNMYVDTLRRDVLCTLWERFDNRLAKGSQAPPKIDFGTGIENIRILRNQQSEAKNNIGYVYLHPNVWKITEVNEEAVQKLRWEKYSINTTTNLDDVAYQTDMYEDKIYITFTGKITEDYLTTETIIAEFDTVNKTWRTKTVYGEIVSLGCYALTTNDVRSFVCASSFYGLGIFSLDKAALTLELSTTIYVDDDFDTKYAPKLIIAADAVYYKARTFIAVLTYKYEVLIYRLNDVDRAPYVKINDIKPLGSGENWIQFAQTTNTLFIVINGVMYECEHGRRVEKYFPCPPTSKPVLGASGNEIMGIFPDYIFYKYREDEANG